MASYMIMCRSVLVELLAGNQCQRIACDDNLLVGGDHHHLHLRVVGREHLLHATAVVALAIHLHTEILHVGAAVL